MTLLSPDFKEFAALLNAHDARYLVVGGHAVGFHGHPRFTGDTDVWIERSVPNSERVFLALVEFGFGGIGIRVIDLAMPDMVIQLGFPPNRIDILTSLEGVAFEDCYPQREAFEADGMSLPVIGLECLRANKRALGRPQDLGDLDALS